MERQEPPFAVQIELTEGCNLRCSFCGVNGIRGNARTYNFMKMSTAIAIANELATAKWTARIEFAMHGEPTMHPIAPEIVGVFRKYLPKSSLMMLSNGGGLLPGAVNKIQALFNAGLNTLGLDEYENINLVPKIIAEVNKGYDPYAEGGWDEFFTYPDDPEGNPHARQRPTARRLVHIKPISLSTAGTHASLNNHAGAGAPLNASGQGKPCAKPFRELSFRWDGSTAVCCNDWRGQLPTGNIRDGLDAIWNGPVMRAARRKLILGQRDFGPCKGCDATSYRVGLLPDKLGRDTLPKPTAADNRFLAERRKQLTPTVKREWE